MGRSATQVTHPRLTPTLDADVGRRPIAGRFITAEGRFVTFSPLEPLNEYFLGHKRLSRESPHCEWLRWCNGSALGSDTSQSTSNEWPEGTKADQIHEGEI